MIKGSQYLWNTADVFPRVYVRENYDLTPRGIVRDLHLLDVDYNAISAYGHFGKGLLPWEE